MKISTATGAAGEYFGDQAAIELLAAAGFEAIDYRFTQQDEGLLCKSILCELFKAPKAEFEEYYRNIRKICEANGIIVGQVHAAAPSYYAPRPDITPILQRAAERSIEACALLGCSHDVIHPPIMPEYKYNAFAAENKKLSVDFYSRLIPTADRCGVMIAIENMWNWDEKISKICPTVCSSAEMNDYIDTMNGIAGKKLFCACLDVGHSNLTGDSPANMIRILGDRLEVLHIHDTDKIDDLHTAPFLGNIDWNQTLGALKEIGYTGTFSLEICPFYERFGKDYFPQSAEFSYKLARAMLDKYKLN